MDDISSLRLSVSAVHTSAWEIWFGFIMRLCISRRRGAYPESQQPKPKLLDPGPLNSEPSTPRFILGNDRRQKRGGSTKRLTPTCYV